MNGLRNASILGSILFPLLGAEPGPAFSGDQSHSVQVEHSYTYPSEIIVSRHIQGQKSLAWKRAFASDENHRPMYPPRPLVTNDGDFVVLHQAPNSRREGRHIQIFAKDGRSLTLKISEFNELLSKKDIPSLTGAFVFEAAFDVLLEKERLYGFWSGVTDRWLAVSLDDLTYSITSDQALIARLNEAARDRALSLVREHQPGSIATGLASIKKSLARLIPALQQAPTSIRKNPQLWAAYIFLGTRKEPSDKALVQGLLKFPLQESFGIFGYQHRVSAEVTSEARILGDYILYRWEDTKPELHFKELTLLAPRERLHTLAGLEVDIELPPYAWRRPGTLWVYLIPAHVPPGKWNRSTGIACLRVDIRLLLKPEHLASKHAPATTRYAFQGVPSGKYRLKAIWDENLLVRRSPPLTLNVLNTTPRSREGPGDFESEETNEFTLEAGDYPQFQLHCTNAPAGDFQNPRASSGL